jgi:hypothetical protein
VNEHKYLFVEPGRDRRKRTEHMRQLLKEPPGPERAHELAVLARELHDNREINLALDTARHALEDVDGDITVLLDVYTSHARPDLVIDDLSMLASLGDWLQHEPLRLAAREQAYQQALTWCGTADGRERERRLDTLRRRFDAELADAVDLALL